MDVTTSIGFENILLGARNQKLLRRTAFKICREKNINIPRNISYFLLFYSITFLEDNISDHKFSNKKLSWINTQVLIKFLDDVDNHLAKKSYWAKAELEKNLKEEKLAISLKPLIKKEIPVILEDPNKKKLSDLYNYS